MYQSESSYAVVNDFEKAGPFGYDTITVTPDASNYILEGTVMALNASTGCYQPYASGTPALATPAIILGARVAPDASATPATAQVRGMWLGCVKESKIICDGVTGTADTLTKATLKTIKFA